MAKATRFDRSHCHAPERHAFASGTVWSTSSAFADVVTMPDHGSSHLPVATVHFEGFVNVTEAVDSAIRTSLRDRWQSRSASIHPPNSSREYALGGGSSTIGNGMSSAVPPLGTTTDTVDEGISTRAGALVDTRAEPPFSTVADPHPPAISAQNARRHTRVHTTLTRSAQHHPSAPRRK